MMVLLFLCLLELFCERGKSVFMNAGVWQFLVEQAMVRLCARMKLRPYLAVHRRSGRYPFAVLQRRGLLCDEVWVCAMFTYNLSQWVSFFKQAFSSRRRFSCSYPHLERRFELVFHSPPYPLQSPGVTVVFSSLFPRSLRSFFPMQASEKNLSASSSRVSNSGLSSIKELASYIYYDHRSISTAPYLTASVTSVTSKPASPFLPIKPTP